MHLVELGQPEAEELAREHEVVAQEVEAAEDALVVREQRLVLAEADLLAGSPAAPAMTTGSPNSSR